MLIKDNSKLVFLTTVFGIVLEQCLSIFFLQDFALSGPKMYFSCYKHKWMGCSSSTVTCDCIKMYTRVLR